MINHEALMRWWWGRVVTNPRLEREVADASQDRYMASYALETC